MLDDPDAERICSFVTAREKMSVGCAEGHQQELCNSRVSAPSSTVWMVRYCFD